MVASIIIPSYDSANTIRKCLQSIVEQKTKFAYEIILVDSSANNIVDGIVQEFPKAKFVKLKKKTYAGIARNIGAEQACGELLVFVDDDVVAPDDWLENVVRYYKSGHGVFASSVDSWNRKKTGILGKLAWFFEQSEFKPSMKEGKRWCLSSTALAVKKELFQGEKFTNMQRSQDVDFTVRLSRKGNILYFNPKLKVFHMADSNFKQLTWKAFNSGLSNMQIRKMHDVSGSYFVRRPSLCFFAIPGFAFTKLIRVSVRNMIYNELQEKILYVCLLPCVILLVGVWMLGAYKGMLYEER